MVVVASRDGGLKSAQRDGRGAQRRADVCCRYGDRSDCSSASGGSGAGGSGAALMVCAKRSA